MPLEFPLRLAWLVGLNSLELSQGVFHRWTLALLN